MRLLIYWSLFFVSIQAGASRLDLTLECDLKVQYDGRLLMTGIDLGGTRVKATEFGVAEIPWRESYFIKGLFYRASLSYGSLNIEVRDDLLELQNKKTIGQIELLKGGYYYSEHIASLFYKRGERVDCSEGMDPNDNECRDILQASIACKLLPL